MSDRVNSRRGFLRGVATVACVSVCAPLIASEGENKMAKSAAQYQDSPKNGERCSGCVQFLPDSNTCKVVEGSISPDGWCQLYSPKP